MCACVQVCVGGRMSVHECTSTCVCGWARDFMSPCAHARLCVCTWASTCVCAHLSTHAGTHTQNTGMGVEEEALLGFLNPLTTLRPRWRDPRMGPLGWKWKMRVKNPAPRAARVQGRESRWPGRREQRRRWEDPGQTH